MPEKLLKSERKGIICARAQSKLLLSFGVDNSLVEPVNANWTGLVTSMCRFDDVRQL